MGFNIIRSLPPLKSQGDEGCVEIQKMYAEYLIFSFRGFSCIDSELCCEISLSADWITLNGWYL